MGRRPRSEVPGAFYHVTVRGNDRREIFVSDVDRLEFVLILEHVASKYRWACFAYCLMTNHVHLVVQIPHGGLSRGMQELNGGYARRFNRRHGAVGHLFQNRFASRTVESDRHLLEACRYVVLNPVRAGLRPRPERWIWSSYRVCVGLEFAPGFLAVNELLGLFAGRPANVQAAYRAFVRDGLAAVSDTVTRL